MCSLMLGSGAYLERGVCDGCGCCGCMGDLCGGGGLAHWEELFCCERISQVELS